MIGMLKKYARGFTELNAHCISLLLAYMLQSISAGMAFFIAIYLDSNFKLSAQIIGIIVSAFSTGNLLGALFAAKITDKTNPFKVSFYSVFVQGLCFCLIPLCANPSFMIGVMFVLGFSGYTFTANNQYLITAVAGTEKSQRSKAISLISVSSNIGVGLGGALVSIFSKDYSYPLLIGAGGLLFITSIYYFISARKIKISSTASSKNASTDRRKEDPNLYFYSLLIIFILGLIFAQQRVSYSLYLNQYFPGSRASSLLLLNSLLIVFGMTSISSISLRFNNYIMMGVGCLLLGGGMFFYQFTYYYPLVLLICIVSTAGEMIGTLVSQLCCFNSSNEKERGKAMGYYKFLYALGTVCGTSVGGGLQTHYGMNTVWLFCGVLAFSMFFISFLMANVLSNSNRFSSYHDAPSK